MTSDNILVAIKIRPLIHREKKQQLLPQWKVQENSIFQVDDSVMRIGEPYSFDNIFTPESTNNDVYQSVVKPLIKSCLEGFNSTIFAYGQTSSGKTHIMMGDDNTLGITQIAINDIFDYVKEDDKRRYLISCSYFEIYNEKINDLLDEKEKDLKIREDSDGVTFITAKEEVVTLPGQVYELMSTGNRIRKIGCTNMNERSSRSHTIFRFTIESTDNSIENGPVQVSQLNLVDLAGSERVAQSKAQGRRLREGVHINKSLSVLGKVIRQLSDTERYISYRDSKLTRLLQQALGGNARSLIIATITVAAGEETKSTLEFAQRAKAIKNKPIINEVLSEPQKLKKYEMVTAGYKERLAIEQRRVEEMEARFQQEKIEREKEIDKLKQQCKLIDIFRKGPDTSKSDPKVFRRHTVGHYGSSSSALEAIPELPLALLTTQKRPGTASSQDSELISISSQDSKDEEISIGSSFASPGRTDDASSVSMRSPRMGPRQNGTSEDEDKTVLAEKLKSMEISYATLQEFMTLEIEEKEKGQQLVEKLKAENEKLLSEMEDVKDRMVEMTRQTEEIQVGCADQAICWQMEVDQHKQESSNLAFRLGEAQAETTLLKAAHDRELKSHRSLLEHRTSNFDKQLDLLKKEIQRLKHRSGKTKHTSEVSEDVQKKIKDLEDENCRLTKETLEKQESIHNLESELLKKDECLNDVASDVLSKLNKLQDVLVVPNNDIQGSASENGEHEDELKKQKKEIHKLKKEKISMTKKMEEIELSKAEAVKLLEARNANVEGDYKTCMEWKSNERVKLQDQISNALRTIEQLKGQLMLQVECNASLTEERDSAVIEMHMLSDLLSLNDEESVVNLVEEHQGLLLQLQNQLKSEQTVTDCNNEMDQFVALLLELKNITRETVLLEEIDLILGGIEESSNNFLTLLEQFSENLNNDINPEYLETAENLNSLRAFVTEKISYMYYTEQDNRELQSKIYRVMQYIDQLNEIRQRINNENSKVKKIEELECKVKDLLQQGTEKTESYEKRIVELESTVAKLKLECGELKASLKGKTKDCDEGENVLKITELTEENMNLRTQLVELTSEREQLMDEVTSLQTTIEDLQMKIQTEIIKGQELQSKLEEMYNENVSLTVKMDDSESPIPAQHSSGEFGTNTDDNVMDPAREIVTLRAEVDELRRIAAELRYDRDELKSELKNFKRSVEVIQKQCTSEVQMEKNENLNLNRQLRSLCSENIELTTKISELQNTLKASKSSESLDSQRSSVANLSFNEERRKKRQSLQDQRRGIETKKIEDVSSEDESLDGPELRTRIKQLKLKIMELTEDNNFLEYEVQGFISEMKDIKKYRSEQDEEIENLKKHIDDVKAQVEKEKDMCKKCDLMKTHIKNLEELHKSSMFKMVDLQTQIYGFKNTADIEKTHRDEIERTLRFKISKLEKELGTTVPREVGNAEVQCELLDYDTLLKKYNDLKKLARMRREEGNILRAKLGLEPDTPVE